MASESDDIASAARAVARHREQLAEARRRMLDRGHELRVALRAEADALRDESARLAAELIRGRNGVATSHPSEMQPDGDARASSHDELSQARDALVDALHELAATISGTAGDVAGELDQLEGVVQHAHEACANSFRGVHDRDSALTAAFEQLSGHLEHGADDLRGHLDNLTQGAQDRTSNFEFHLAPASRRTIDEAERSYLQDAVARLSSALDDLRRVFGVLLEAAEAGQSLMGNRAGDVIHGISSVMATIEKIRPVLEMVEALA